MATSIETVSGKLIFEKSNFLHKNSRHEKVVRSKHFTYRIDVLLPGCASLPLEVAKQLTDDRYWIVHKFPFSRIIDKEFIEAFVRKGQIHMLSHNRRIDTDNCAAVLPTGELILHIDKDTYEELGLEGAPSIFNHKRSVKYVVKINLLAPSFVPGKKNYERVRWCLSERLNLHADFLLLWNPPDADEAICPSSVPVYLQNAGYTVTACKSRRKTSKLSNFSMPVIASQYCEETEEHCSYQQFWEWLGVQVLEVDCSEAEADSFLNTLCCPSPAKPVPDSTLLRLTGFFTIESVENIISAVRRVTVGQKLEWASVTCHGFVDSPVSWGSWEHGCHKLDGDNLYTYTVFPNEDYWLYIAFGSHDAFT